eukprot:TRINITY_DN15322_c0_g1_i1.p1 TRINITY_DN15322_c0_g1~~TRINITY_DN15322_c0_g1_i1.p1  ORF type:complete len:413 (+),score=117.90 TRINITY_DN15322_c0_g1_i1:53-1240(+)
MAVRSLYRQLLRHCVAIDAAPVRKGLLLAPQGPSRVYLTRTDTWQELQGRKEQDKHVAAFQRELIGGEAFFVPAADGSTRKAVPILRRHFRAALADPTRTVLQDGFAALRWLSEVADVAKKLKPTPRAPRRPRPIFSQAGDRPVPSQPRFLLSNPIALWEQSGFRHSIVLLFEGERRGSLDGFVVNCPLQFTVRDMVAGRISGITTTSTDPLLRAFADSRLFFGGYVQPTELQRLYVLHQHPNVQCAKQLLPGLWIGGELRSMLELCMDKDHPAKPEDFKFLWGRLAFTETQLEGEIGLGVYQPVAIAESDPAAAGQLVMDLLNDAPPPGTDLSVLRSHVHGSWQRAAADLKGDFADAWGRLPGPAAKSVEAGVSGEEVVSAYLAEAVGRGPIEE